MADQRVEYRFVLSGQTPDTITQARLAEYLGYLSALYGEERAVHFVKLDPSSLAVVSSVEADSDDVSERVNAADSEVAPHDVRRTYQSLRRCIIEVWLPRIYCAWVRANPKVPTTTVSR